MNYFVPLHHPIDDHYRKFKVMQYHIFSPYRVCPLGAHVDHQHGLVTGFAIDKGVDLWFDINQIDNGKLTIDNYCVGFAHYSNKFPQEYHNFQLSIVICQLEHSQHKLSFSGASTFHYCVIPREQSDRGNLIVQCSSVSYGFRICSTQYIEIATPPSVARNDTCGVDCRSVR
jgi:hypothetical protein